MFSINLLKIAILHPMRFVSNGFASGIGGILAIWCVLAAPAAGQGLSQKVPDEVVTQSQSKKIITMKSGRTTDYGDTISLSAQVTFDLPGLLVDALNKGVSLIFIAELQVLREREVLADKEVVDLQLPRRLRYHALTRKYIVDDLATSGQAMFNSLNAALSHLGKYEDMPLIKVPLAKASQATHARMRMYLQRSNLPFPLRLQSYFSMPWSLSSEWYQWSL